MYMKRCFLVIICICIVFTAGCNRNRTKDEKPEPTLGPVTKATATPSPIPSDIPSAGISEPDIYNEPQKPVFVPERERGYKQLPYKPVSYEKKIAPYSVKPDLSNIENLDQFGEFTEAQKEMLKNNLFVVTRSDQVQLFHIYEQNEYKKIPSFITVDSVLQVYHIFFDYSLRTLEAETLLADLEVLTGSMLEKSIYLYNIAQNPDIKKAAMRNIAYFLVAQKTLELDPPANVPEDAAKIAGSEYRKILEAPGFSESEIAGCDVDYSQFTVRGHYTRNHDLERFFRTMMWYGLVPFPLSNSEGNINDESIARSLLITYSIFLPSEREEQDIDLWENIYDPTVFYVGKADDLTVYDYMDLLIKIYGEEPDPDSFAVSEKLREFYEQAKSLRSPGIQTAFLTVDSPSGKQFRFMGQRYIPDSEILQRLVNPPIRNMPSGLDVMAVLGSEEAYNQLINIEKIPDIWPGYPERFLKVKEKFDGLSPDIWQSNMYYGWLWTLKPLLCDSGEGYPSFMNKPAWKYKSLNTALASWAELRHDTILYGKQSGAECGGDWPPPVIKSYVEPNIEVYERLLWLTRYSKENLLQKGILPDRMHDKLTQFEDLLTFLINCSVKELRNEELTVDEYNTLLIYGGTLEWLTLSMAEGPILSETDRNMAVIADVHTVPGSYLEVGVGPASEVFVVVPIGEKLYLTRGAVFSYYEFVSGKRLTDEQWQQLFKEGAEPSQPTWTNEYTKGKKDEIPVPAEPFNSGC